MFMVRLMRVAYTSVIMLFCRLVFICHCVLLVGLYFLRGVSGLRRVCAFSRGIQDGGGPLAELFLGSQARPGGGVTVMHC